MQSLKDKKKMAMVLILAVGLAAGTGLGAWILSQQVHLTMRISAAMEILLRDTVGVELTDVALGIFQRGETRGFPSIDGSTYYTLENNGAVTMYVRPSYEGFDPDVSILAYIRKPGGEWTELGPSEPWIEGVNAIGTPGAFVAEWYFVVDVGDIAAYGDYAPTLVWNAYDNG